MVVPREYIFYDVVTGEHLERPGLTHIRRQLVPEKKIEGVIFPTLDRLSREPMHVAIFEFELDHCGVKYHYADAPSGNDPMYQMLRQNLAYAAKMVKISNRKNNRAGNIGRVLKGMVPAHKAPYGYEYNAVREIGDDARVHIKDAWWELNSVDKEGVPVEGSPAYVVGKIFHWIGDENRTMYWVANTLNDMGIATPGGCKWTPPRVSNILRNRCYTGRHAYNVHMRVPNPATHITDVTAEIKRTLLQKKPEEEWVNFEVPKIVDADLWERANRQVKARGRGRGKQGKSIQALLRNRISCPRCGAPMVVRRAGKLGRTYYHCSKYFRKWADPPCTYNKFIPATWDETVWMDVCTLLSDDTWLEKELEERESKRSNIGKLTRLEQFKITQAKSRIAKIQEGFEDELYSLEEAKSRTASYHDAVTRAEKELARLRSFGDRSLAGECSLESLKAELRAIRDGNLDKASFEEKVEVVTKLGIEVYPAEDLRTMRVKCRLGSGGSDDSGKAPQNGGPAEEAGEVTEECGIVSYAPPTDTRAWLLRRPLSG